MTKHLKTLFTLALVIGLAVFISDPHPVFAAIRLDDSWKPDGLPSTIPLQEATDPNHPETAITQTLIFYAGQLLSRVLLFASTITIFFLIFAGFFYITAFGNEDKINRGKRGVLWSSVGLIVILLAYSIVQGVLWAIQQVDVAAQ